MKYKRITTPNTRRDIYILLAFMLGMLASGTFWVAYSAFRGINKPLESPLSGIVEPVYAGNTEIPKQNTRWWRLYQIVQLQESSFGTKGLAVTCKKKGKVNDIGYLPYKGFCFGSEEEQESTFAAWMTKRMNYDGLSDAALLCAYNTGVAHKSCAYSRGDLTRAK